VQLNLIAPYCFAQLHPCIMLYIKLLASLVQAVQLKTGKKL